MIQYLSPNNIEEFAKNKSCKQNIETGKKSSRKRTYSKNRRTLAQPKVILQEMQIDKGRF